MTGIEKGVPMKSFRLAIVAVIILAGFAAPQAWAVRIDPYAKRVEEQKADNERWLREAKENEAKWFQIAEEHKNNKNYDKACKYYRRVAERRYKQWKFPDNDGGTQRPAKQTMWIEMRSTAQRTAVARLREMDKVVNEEEIRKLIEAAEVAELQEDVAGAYRAYGNLIEFADRVGAVKYAAQAANRARKAQEKLLREPTKALDEIQKLLDADKVEETRRKLDEFQQEYGDMLRLAGPLAERFQKMGGVPVLAAAARERAAFRRVMEADAALARQDFAKAYKGYSFVIVHYGDTAAAKEAAEKLANLYADPGLRKGFQDQQLEEECRLLLFRARALVRAGRLAEARAACDKIVIKYPESRWAAEAVDLLEEIKGKEKELPAE